MKEWMVRQADTNTIPDTTNTIAYETYKNLVKFCRLSRLLKAWTDDAHKTSSTFQYIN